VAPKIPPEIKRRQNQILVKTGSKSLVGDLGYEALSEPSPLRLLVLVLDWMLGTGEGALPIFAPGLGFAKIPDASIQAFLNDRMVR
jgi:hypothetical protein